MSCMVIFHIHYLLQKLLLIAFVRFFMKTIVLSALFLHFISPPPTTTIVLGMQYSQPT